MHAETLISPTLSSIKDEDLHALSLLIIFMDVYNCIHCLIAVSYITTYHGACGVHTCMHFSLIPSPSNVYETRKLWPSILNVSDLQTQTDLCIMNTISYAKGPYWTIARILINLNEIV